MFLMFCFVRWCLCLYTIVLVLSMLHLLSGCWFCLVLFDLSPLELMVDLQLSSLLVWYYWSFFVAMNSLQRMIMWDWDRKLVKVCTLKSLQRNLLVMNLLVIMWDWDKKLLVINLLVWRWFLLPNSLLAWFDLLTTLQLALNHPLICADAFILYLLLVSFGHVLVNAGTVCSISWISFLLAILWILIF